MREKIHDGSTFNWIDVVDPTPTELQEVAQEFDLHPLFVQDCLDPEHLPKVDKPGESLFVIVRVFDFQSTQESSTVQELTRKVAIFFREDFILTIHRTPLPFIQKMAELVKAKKIKLGSAFSFITFLCKDGVLSFEKPLETAERELEKYEDSVSKGDYSADTLYALHCVRRRLTTLNRLFWPTLTIVQRLPIQHNEESSLHLHDLRETLESLMFFCDGLLEDATSLLGLELSMAQKKTNEVIQVLTIFSVFFMPLTFIAGVYGMNFANMPEIKWEYGYSFALVLMVVVTAAIYRWFRSKDWM